MAIVNVPANVKFTDFDISLDAPSDEMKSPFNGKRQVAKLPFDVWNFDGDLVPLDPMDAGAVKSFLMKLAGRVNTFRLRIAGSKYPTSGYVGPNGAVDGIQNYDEGLASTYIKVVGFTPNTLILREGDYFNIGNELKVATLNRTAEPSGISYVYFMPPLRNTTMGLAVTLSDPFLYLHATDDDVARWNVKPPVRHSFKLRAEEEI